MKDKNIIITRKYTLVPTFSNTKEWIKKIMEYTKKSYEEKIEYYSDKLKKTKNNEDKIKIENKLQSLNTCKIEFEENGTITQTNVNDYTYDLVRRAMDSESERKNIIIGYVYSELLLNHNVKNMDFKERNKLIGELTNYGYRIKGSKKGSLCYEIDIDIPLGGYGVAFNQELTNKIKDMVNKDHVLEGKSSPINYKSDSPFTIAKSAMSFTHDYDSFEELC